MLHFLPVLFIVLRCGYTLNPPINVSSSLTRAPVSRGAKGQLCSLSGPGEERSLAGRGKRGDGYARWVARGEGRTLGWGEERGSSSKGGKKNHEIYFLWWCERNIYLLQGGYWNDLHCGREIIFINGMHFKNLVYLQLLGSNTINK